ncbi:MAG: alpha/beta fold hydrolase [Deltaproteobacteria bacterium]|nr:alpha/beta fold hydrolase [Deltaproteobacteria bacterium]
MRRGFLIIVIWFLAVMPAAAAGYDGETFELGGLKVAVWSAAEQAAVKKPVIIFSHGFHGNATQSCFLMEALAEHGYLVFAPDHQDALGLSGIFSWFSPPEERFRRPAEWSEQTYRDRGEDIRKLVAAIQTDERFREQADLRRLGLVGHSLGGYTMLALAGAWRGWRLNGIKAVLALSPYTQPFVVHSTLQGLQVPVMYQGGTRDFAITPALRRAKGAYDQTPGPKYFVEFTGAGHLAWTDLRSSCHQEIIAYSRAFLDHYVKGLPAAPMLTQAMPGVAEWRYDSDLGTGGATAGRDGGRPSLRERLRQRLNGTPSAD